MPHEDASRFSLPAFPHVHAVPYRVQVDANNHVALGAGANVVIGEADVGAFLTVSQDLGLLGFPAGDLPILASADLLVIAATLNQPFTIRVDIQVSNFGYTNWITQAQAANTLYTLEGRLVPATRFRVRLENTGGAAGAGWDYVALRSPGA